MIESTIVKALTALGFFEGWAANENDGIILWENDMPQPTEAELVAAGWIKPGEQNAPTTVEEEDNNAPVADSSSGPSAD